MLSIFERIKTWWTNADRTQRMVTLGSIGALVLLLIGTTFFATRTRYGLVAGNLSETEKAQIVEALQPLGIPVDYSQPNAVMVPENRVSEARMKLSEAGKMPKGSSHWGLSELTKSGPFTSPEVEAQTMKAVQEGEIASMIETMEGVASAQVLITLPKQSVFQDDKTPPTASVTIVEDGHGSLTPTNGRMIAGVVCNAVDGMRMEDVVVVSNSMGELYNGKNAESSDSKTDLDSKVARQWETKLQSGLDAIFGAGNTKVMVRADVDTARRTLREHQVQPTAAPTSVSKQQEKLQGRTTVPGGVAGAASNTASGAAALASKSSTSDGANGYDGKIEQKQYGESTVDRDTQDGVGDLKGLAITVVANSDKVSEPEKIKEIVNGVMGGKIETDASGAAKLNQPFTTTVTSVKFDGSAAAAAKDAADKAAGQQRTQQIVSLLPIAAILIVALLVAKQVGRISKSVLPAVAPTEMALATETVEYAEDGTPMLAAAGALPGGSHSAIVRAINGEPEEEPLVLEAFRDKIDPNLESLKNLASERPELLATLIKSTMLGERS